MRTEQINQTDGKNAFIRLFLRNIPFWPLFAITIFISFAVCFVKLKFTVPVYQTNASILIKDEKKGQEDSKMEEVLNVFGSKKIVENEQEVLKSNSIVSEVARRLHLYAPIFEESGWRSMKARSGYISCPVSIEAKNPDEIQRLKKAYFEYDSENKKVLYNSKSYALNEWITTGKGTIRFVLNKNYKKVIEENEDEEEVSKFYFQLYPIKSTTLSTIEGLTIVPSSKQSSVINISYKDPVPERAQNLLNELVKVYNLSSIERKNQVAIKTLEFIEERLSHVSRELDSVESGIQRYRNNTGVVNIGEQSRQYLEGIETNDKQLNTLNLQLTALDQVESYLSQKEGQSTIAPATFNIQDQSLNNLLQNYYTNEAQYERMKRTNGENFPAVVALKEELEKSRPAIIENISNQKKNIEAGKSYLSKISTRYSGMLNSIPKKEKELVEVSRQQNIKKDIYSFLLQKKEEISYSISSILPDCYLVSNPTTDEIPVSPKKPLYYLIALIIPLILSSIVIYVKDIFNHKIMFRSDIESYSTYPILGELVEEKVPHPLVTGTNDRSFVIEQFRQIRTVLKHQGNPPGNIKRISITSAIKGDGKSFVSGNLAMSFARSGKKVALLELDLHQPKISEMFGIPPTIGLTEYLDNAARVENIIYKSNKNENLFIIPSGYPHDDASELLQNEKLEKLLEHLDKVFDIIIMDTVPYKALTDAFSIGAKANIVLVVIRHNHTPVKIIERIHEDMEAQKIEQVALIFNGVKKRGMGQYSYGYGYGYGYDQKSKYDEYNKGRVKKIS